MAGARTTRTPAAQLRLFAPDELLGRPTAASRLLRLATLPPRAATGREVVEDEDRRTIDRLRRYGRDLARRFRLRYLDIESERDGVTAHYGICYEDGMIRIRLRHAVTHRLLKDSSLVDTLCHELAHLKHFDHSPRFWRFYRRILDEARRLGYYRPGRPQAAPRQGSLLDLLEPAAGCSRSTNA